MNIQTWQRLDQEFTQFPIMRALEIPSEEEIAEAAAAIGCTFHEDYVMFLRRYGGAMVGSLPVFGLRPAPVTGMPWHVVEVTKWFREQGWPGVNEWYVISDDGFGNPIGVAPDGRVMISDHDSGLVRLLAKNFEEFLLHHCLRAN
jgi:hypothetical protein